MWWVLIGSCLGLFILMLDSTIVSLALPEIRRELEMSSASLQWVMNGYLLTIAVLVVTAGRLGANDVVGDVEVFVVDPGRGPEPHGREGDALAAARRAVEAPVHVGAERLDFDPAAGARLDDRDLAGVARDRARLEAQDARVLGRESVYFGGLRKAL